MIKILTALFTSIIVLFCVACSSEHQSEIEEKFQVINPQIRDTVYQNEYVAEIAAVQNVEVRTRIKGYIEAIHVDEGQRVKKGQTLFSINNKELQQELQKAKAILKNALAELKSAEIELANITKLFNKNIVSKSEVDLLETKVEAVKAKVEETESEEDRAENNLSFTEIKAPFDGIINRIPNKTGSLVEEGQLLTTISNTTEVFAYFNLSEADYLNYIANNGENESKEVILMLANDSLYQYEGKVEIIESEFDQSTGNISFRARFPNPEAVLKHGANGKIIVKRKLHNVLLIPQKSTFEIQDKVFVFVVKQDSVLEQRNVQVQMRIPHFYILKSGLSDKDLILYEGSQSVRNGDKVIPEKVAFKDVM